MPVWGRDHARSGAWGLHGQSSEGASRGRESGPSGLAFFLDVSRAAGMPLRALMCQAT